VGDDEFWAARQSLLTPIPALEEAADLLSQAVDCLLSGDEAGARALLTRADMRELRDYTNRAVSQTSTEVHRRRTVEGPPRALSLHQRGRRQPNAAEKVALFRRDGCRCRYCGCRVVLPAAQNALSAALPGSVTWGAKDIALNAAFYTLKGVLDHVVPHASGGDSGPGNLVVSCQPCNYGKGSWTLEELGLLDPRQRPPVAGDWDGLGRILAWPGRNTAKIALRRTTPPRRAGTARQRSAAGAPDATTEWLASLADPERRHAEKLLSNLTNCRHLGVEWSAREVLAVRIVVEGETLTLMGVLRDGEVQIPWAGADKKDASRRFAEVFAAAVPEAELYETARMWRVRKGGRQLRLHEVVEAADALQAAFDAALHASPHDVKPDTSPTASR
jgi:5-methylcytosine-specific restriction endonuclease McrA